MTKKSSSLSFGQKVALWGLVVAIIGTTITVLGFVFDIFGQPKVSLGSPQFEYIYKGAFDPTKPEYEVAFPLGWGDSTQVSNAEILLHAKYSGGDYDGIASVKIQKSDGEIVDTGQQWDDFNSKSGHPLNIPLTFRQLFDYAGLAGSVPNLDVSAESPALKSGQFTVYVEYMGQHIEGSERTITVYNTPWFHRVYFDYSEVMVGEKLKAYVEIFNYGAESDFSVATCPYRIVTPSYQVDPSQVMRQDEIGWWPTRSGNLQALCDGEQQTPAHLGLNDHKTVMIELPQNATAEQGYYDYIVFVLKKLPTVAYNGDWFETSYSRDSRQHSMYVVIGQ
jgi:hypothetical protein